MRTSLFATWLLMGTTLGCADLIGLDHLKDSVNGGETHADGTPPDSSRFDEARGTSPLDASSEGSNACPLATGCLPTPPSCAGGAAPCVDSDSCCETLYVTGGVFSRGYDVSNTDSQDALKVFGWAERGVGSASVSDFWLDKYEVTVARFRKFVDAYDAWLSAGNPREGRGAHYKYPTATGWQVAQWSPLLPRSAAELKSDLAGAATCPAPNRTWTDTAGDRENLPMNCLTWYEAFLFCLWDGGRLPTDAEWNYAAAGGEQQRAFPWSDPPGDHTIFPTYAVYDRDTSSLNIAPVGSIGGRDGRWGQRDLAGNVWEWVFDACASCDGPTHDGPELSSYPMICAECPSVQGGRRFFRGGSWKFSSNTLRSAFRAGTSPEVRYDDLGVRCARNPVNGR